jgi:hypothetical protein
MEEYLGRYLNNNEVVHHINGDRLDNRIENLQLCSSQTEHIRRHRYGMRIIDVDIKRLVDLYDLGKSVKELSKIFGVSRGAIHLRLRDRGIIPRNRSQSMYLRMSQTSDEERKILTTKARIARTKE